MNKRIISLAMTAVFILSALTSCASNRPLTSGQRLELGENYLLELDYEMALVQFLRVIEAEPDNPRGYTGAAEAYIGIEQPSNAAAILLHGLTAVAPEDTETLTEMLAMLDGLEE